MCLALEYFDISFSMSFVAVRLLISDPCLPHEDKRSVVPFAVGLQGLQKAWTHAMGHVLPKTQSQYLLLFWHCRALGPGHLMLSSRASHELSQLGGCITAWWRLVRDMRMSLNWESWKFHLTGNKAKVAGVPGYACSFHSLGKGSWALQWIWETHLKVACSLFQLLSSLAHCLEGYSLPVLGKHLETQEHRELRRGKVHCKTKMVKSDLQMSGCLRETRALLSSI